MGRDQERKRPLSYIRVSSLGQVAEETLERQHNAIVACATDLGVDIHQEYVDRPPDDNHTSTQEE